MKLFLIKLGKSFSVIRRDGIRVGGKRVLDSIGLTIKTMLLTTSGDVLIVTGGIGDSAYYRAFNHAEELNVQGIRASVMIQDNPFLARYAKKFSVFVFHRTLYTGSIRKLIEKIKLQKKIILFETDDLVFDAKYIKETDLYRNKMTRFEKMQYENGIGAEILADPYVTVCTTSTTYLAGILKKYGKQVFVVRNKISLHEYEVAENILASRKKHAGSEVRIGYFSGTPSHNKDFSTVTEALIKVLRTNPETRLYLAGPLDMDHALNEFSSHIVTLPFTPRDKYYENIFSVDINLAPLVPDDPFCEAKSEIKFIEAGIVGVPTVAVKNQTYSEAITDGVDGFLAGSTEEWVEKITTLVKDPSLRRQMGERAREKVLRDYTVKNSHEGEYYQYLREVIKKSG
jgi:glycosyltransferase involved in cell wall biosynthesis